MTEAEAIALFDGANPVKLADGKLGLLIRCVDEAGIQVPAEADIRWIPYAQLWHAGGGAFIEVPI